jgi:FkbM family methyltransferase
VIIDAGAHVGVASHWFARRYPGALVLAFEPNPETFALLEANLRRNGLRRVAPFNAAVAPVAGVTPLWTVPGDSWGDATVRQVWHDTQPVRRVEAVAVTLSSLLAGPVDLVKLDIEGVETAVLAEAAPRLRLVRRIVLEFHGSAGNPDNRLEDVLAILKRVGFRTRVEQEGKSRRPPPRPPRRPVLADRPRLAPRARHRAEGTAPVARSRARCACSRKPTDCLPRVSSSGCINPL